MPVVKPYRRTCRPFINGSYSSSGNGAYIGHPKFSQAPEHFIRAFHLLQSDLLRLFEFVEPSHVNLSAYSFRIHEILMRACMEVEANCKAILVENGYTKAEKSLAMADYKKIDLTHHLSSYEVQLPVWKGDGRRLMPFRAWSTKQPLLWYHAYNTTKHSRHTYFEQANFGHMLDAVCGLLVILSAQFHTQEFSSQTPFLSLEGRGDGLSDAIGGYFRIGFPSDWSVEQRYDFNWRELKDQEDPFQSLEFEIS